MELTGYLIRVGEVRKNGSDKDVRDFVIQEEAMYPQSARCLLYGENAKMDWKVGDRVRAYLNLRAYANNRDGMEYFTNMVDCWKIEKV